MESVFLSYDGIDESAGDVSPPLSAAGTPVQTSMSSNDDSGLQHRVTYLPLPNTAPVTPTLDATSDLPTPTPLTKASPAIGSAFPFPRQLGVTTATKDTELSQLASRRLPSVLRYPSKLSSSTMDRRRTTSGVAEISGHNKGVPKHRATSMSPDRFVPPRTPPSATRSAKQSYLLGDPSSPTARDRIRSSPGWRADLDPFRSDIRSRERESDRFHAIRAPRPLRLRSASYVTGSRVPVSTARASALRAASHGAVWGMGSYDEVGGNGGVRSTTDGRGGRLVSGSSAPFYTSDFFAAVEPSEEQQAHEERLALALETDVDGRVLNLGGLPTPPRSPTAVSWTDSEWQRPDAKVLDAPALRDDYYTTLLSFSPTAHCLAVGLGNQVYLWSEREPIRTLRSPELNDHERRPPGHVTSVSFSSEQGGSSILAVGRADGRITLWSTEDEGPRFDAEQPMPVSCVCFRPTTTRRTSTRDPHVFVQVEDLLVGDEAGHVWYYSVEWPDDDDRAMWDWHGSMTLLARVRCHNQQVCGLAWSPALVGGSGGTWWASGGNDNSLFVFETERMLELSSLFPLSGNTPGAEQRERTAAPPSTARVEVHLNHFPPRYPRHPSRIASRASTANHQTQILDITPDKAVHHLHLNAAVKALAFAPFQPNLLAAGGGSNDRCIHFWHVGRGGKAGVRLAGIE
ncbi:hypothetical protein LTR50_006097 [Elasticomyces elasticus]|nr:hypothetical protein LTR50_006097 [Elasticomyces elasticus]